MRLSSTILVHGPAIFLALLGLPSLVQGYASNFEAQMYEDYNQGIETTQKMWVMGSDGIHIFTADGEEKVHRGSKQEVCQNIEDPWATPGTFQNDCWYISALMDGENYVFSINSNWVEDTYVDIFSMWTGRFLGSIPMCTAAFNMHYAPNRRELWAMCWIRPWNSNANFTDAGQVDIISTQNLGAQPQKVQLYDLDIHAHGDVLVDLSIPNKAYVTSAEGPNIYEIHAGSKQLLNTIPVEDTLFTKEMAFSPVNKHIFIRTYSCCSCGETKDTRGVCNENYMEEGGVIVTNGPNASPDPQPGYCGLFCRGSRADTNGLWEFDTQTNAFVGKHQPANGATGSKAFVTPLGDFILIGAGDGGNAVKVLKPGRNGELSMEVGVINLEFGADAGTHAFSDVAFIEDDVRNIAIFTSTLNNHIVIVDMSGFDGATSSNPVAVEGFDLELFETPPEEISVEHDVRGISVRNVAWAAGTDYMWVDSAATNQMHVIQLAPTISDTKVVKVIDNVEGARQILWVHNFEQDAAMKKKAEMKAESEAGAALEAEDESTSESDDTLSIVAIVVSIIAIVMGFTNLIVLNSTKNRVVRIPDAGGKGDHSVSVSEPPSDDVGVVAGQTEGYA